MALHKNRPWLAIVVLATAMIFAEAFSQDSKEQDSLSGNRELVIATSAGHQPDSLSRPRVAESTRNHTSTKSSPTALGVYELHPQAVAFVSDYLEVHESRLNKMKSWAGPYFRMIDQILAKYNLPTELKYLAVIESNLKPTALSNKGAVGPWQFMAETGRLYGLKISGSRDDRRDLYKSTHAAARYLRDLHRELGDWLLVIAAYNGGDARVTSAIRKSGSRDFWKLQYYLPAESRNHVKKFIATHYIFEGQGGVTTTVAADLRKMGKIPADPKLLEGTVTQEVSGKYHSAIITKTLGMDILQFNALNPQFDQKVGVETYSLRLPSEKMDQFNLLKNQVLGESVIFLMSSPEANKEDYPELIKVPVQKKPAPAKKR